jgi:hypothetical protein
MKRSRGSHPHSGGWIALSDLFMIIALCALMFGASIVLHVTKTRDKNYEKEYREALVEISRLENYVKDLNQKIKILMIENQNVRSLEKELEMTKAENSKLKMEMASLRKELEALKTLKSKWELTQYRPSVTVVVKWNRPADVDLLVTSPSGEKYYFNQLRDSKGLGEILVDTKESRDIGGGSEVFVSSLSLPGSLEKPWVIRTKLYSSPMTYLREKNVDIELIIAHPTQGIMKFAPVSMDLSRPQEGIELLRYYFVKGDIKFTGPIKNTPHGLICVGWPKVEYFKGTLDKKTR